MARQLITISNGDVESPGIHTEYPPVHSPWNTIYGPEFGVTLNIYGTLNYDWMLGAVQNNPVPGNRSIINMYNGSQIKCDYGAAIGIGDMWWWQGGPYVTLNMYGNSFVNMTNGAGFWLGGHVNLYDTSTFKIGAGGYVNMDVAGVINDQIRFINIAGGSMVLPTGWTNAGTSGENSGTVYDWIGRGVLRVYGKVLDTNELSITDDGTHTIVTTAVSLGGSLQRVYLSAFASCHHAGGGVSAGQAAGGLSVRQWSACEYGGAGSASDITAWYSRHYLKQSQCGNGELHWIVTAVAPGTATLSATLGAFTSTNTLTVSVVPVCCALGPPLQLQ